MEIDNIYNCDCLEGMADLPSGHKYCIVTDPRTPSIAIITWYECDHYDAIDPEKYKDKKNGKHTRKPTV